MKKYIEKIKNLLKQYVPYYVAHVIIALVFMCLVGGFTNPEAGLFTGLTIYTTREVTQYEYEKFFDWKGVVYPNSACLVIYGIIKLLELL